MITKMIKFLAGFLICALFMGAYPIPAYGSELPPSTEEVEDTEENEEIEDTEDTENDAEEPEDKWIVVLDPGHDGIDGGASRTINGIQYIERDLVLKIAYYCKAELEKYDNVIVYMTRTDNVSPGMDRQQRAYFAASVGADVLVSFHLNATSSTTTYSQSGAEVYAPNPNYKADISQAGCYMSQNILLELQALGVPNNGIKFRYTEDNSIYPDGSLGDYLGINYWSKMYGFPGVLIEHAYINNPTDVANFLSTEQGLMNLGIADARGIMNTLNNGQFVYEKGIAGTWRQSANGLWWFEYATGGWPSDQWLNIWGQWYYFNAEGYMVSGWLYWNNNWYYLGGPDDGVMKTGWQYINNQWYYLGPNGDMYYGWHYINNQWYYFGESYDGAMKYGWLYWNNDWYYLGSPQDGAMKTGWLYVNGVWYYTYESGAMAYNTWIGNYYVNEWGAWTATR